jgi:hypothetical protein
MDKREIYSKLLLGKLFLTWGENVSELLKAAGLE